MLLATGGGRRSDDGATDAQLLTRLRAGDRDAYTLLWQRHIALALHVARSYAPGSAEDLASESFLAVYRQVAIEQKGPENAFRPYLLTTMRNLAIKWGRTGKLIDTDPDIDQIDDNDPLSQLSDEAEAGEMLAAFSDLPERWQRVLWLSEVEQVPRAEIAAEFGISRNAVSALAKRAKSGLRVQWLTKQLAPGLLTDPAHPTGLIPAYVAEKGSLAASDRRSLEHHLDACTRCAELHRELRALDRRTRGTTLGVVGFAALAGVIPASGTTTGAGTAALLFGGAAVGTTAAAGVGAFAVGSVLTAALVLSGIPLGATSTGAPPQADGKSASSVSASGSAGADQRSESTTGEKEQSASGPTDDPSPHSADAQADGTELGRNVQNSALTSLELGPGGPSVDYRPPPAAPTPAGPGTVPDPAPEPPTDIALLSPGVAPLPQESRYIAPALSGRTAPEASIALEYRYADPNNTSAPATRYTVQPGADGSWAFDLRSLGEGRVGTHEYRVWAFTADESSEAVSGSYTISTPSVSGIDFFTELPLDEASNTGLVFRVTGAPRTTICLSAGDPDQRFEILLDDSGNAARRMRLHAYGFYYLALQQCDEVSATEMYRGPASEVAVDVTDEFAPIFSPWAPGLESIELEFVN